MKYFYFFAILLIGPSCAQAQDTFFTLAKAPLAISKDNQTRDFTFTNTSGLPLHRIKISSYHEKEQKSVVIIEALGPHKTITYDITKSLAVGADYREASVTCAHYSIPIKLSQY